MGFARLDLRCPKSLDPKPTWTLADVLAEIESLESRRRLQPPTPLKQPPPEWELSLSSARRGEAGRGGNAKPFVMRVDDDAEDDDSTSDEDSGDEKKIGHALVTAASVARFSCNDLESSDFEELEVELDGKVALHHLMEKRSIEKSILFELEHEHHLQVQDEVRSKLAALEADHKTEIERTVAAFARLQKYVDARRDMDKRLDKHYQRKIAEMLDKHLSAVQRDHEQRSQIVERRIRDDAALQEAQRKQQALTEEKLRQERAKQEAMARQKAAAKLAEEAKKAALDAAQKKAAEEEVARLREPAASHQTGALMLSSKGSTEIKEENTIKKDLLPSKEKHNELSGIKVFAANAALEAEARRVRLFNELPEISHVRKEFGKYDRQIAKSINKLIPTKDSVKARAQEIINVIHGQECPRSIPAYLFANKIVSLARNRFTKDKTFETTAFACGYVILLVSDKVPEAMDYVLAEFHKVCIYTVPKHLQPLNASARTKDYFKMIGYHEEDGKLENTEIYLTYLVAYMKLYAAMIQSEIIGVRHPHGLAEGWKWVAMFLNALPATTATAFALEAFLKMAGFALYKRYGSQFLKIVDVISRCFLPALREQGSKVQADAMKHLEHYVDDRMYLKEPEGRLLAAQLLSTDFF